MTMPVTAILTEWTTHNTPHGLKAIGKIQFDARNRHANGEIVTTSPIERIIPMGTSFICYTRNSLYVLA